MKFLWDNDFKVKKGDRLINECRCCKKQLPDEVEPALCSHVISKGSNTFLRYHRKNMHSLCFKCHQEYDFGKLVVESEYARLVQNTKDQLKTFYTLSQNNIRVPHDNPYQEALERMECYTEQDIKQILKNVKHYKN